MPNRYTWTEITSKGKQAAAYANTQINHVSLNCMDGNLYHWQILLSINYFDEQWSEGMMPRVTFHSSKEMESIDLLVLDQWFSTGDNFASPGYIWQCF